MKITEGEQGIFYVSTNVYCKKCEILRIFSSEVMFKCPGLSAASVEQLKLDLGRAENTTEAESTPATYRHRLHAVQGGISSFHHNVYLVSAEIRSTQSR